jgi:hypothetical protein
MVLGLLDPGLRTGIRGLAQARSKFPVPDLSCEVVAKYLNSCKKKLTLKLETLRAGGFPTLKGQCHEIFCFWFFFMNQFPPSSRVFHLDRFKFFRKFAEIFASQGAPPVPTLKSSPVDQLRSAIFLLFCNSRRVRTSYKSTFGLYCYPSIGHLLQLVYFSG